MSLVLDASLVVAYALQEAIPVESEAAMRQTVADGAVVPSIWRLEVGNALLMAVVRRKISLEDRSEMLAELGTLAIEIDVETDARAWSSTLRIADRQGLTLYDAAYLELADRRGLSLATLDQKLRTAAATMGVALR